MKLLLSFIVIVGITMVSTNQMIVNHFFNFPNGKVDVTKNVRDKWSSMASIWIKDTNTNSIMPKLNCTAVIITEKHILTPKECVENVPIESIAVVYGVQDTKNIKLGDLHTPKKLFQVETEYVFHLEVLEMDTIKYTKLVQPACIPPSFDYTINKTLTVTGFSRILDQIKTLNSSLVHLTNCGWDRDENHLDMICQSITPITDESNMIIPGSLVQWFNSNNKKWILVGMTPYGELNSSLIGGYNVPFVYPSIKKIVEDGSSKLSTC